MIDFITPMSPKLKSFSNLEDYNYYYQIKWDGVRILTYKLNDTIKLINKNKKDKTKQFPEFEILRDINKDFILDGEAMVIEGNKNSFSKILKRNMTIDSKKIDYYLKVAPITYAVFDILYYDSRWLINEPIEKRQELLHWLLKNNCLIHICKNYDSAIELYKSTKNIGLEGIIAKKKGSKYTPGKKSYDWVKHKHVLEIQPYIGGVLLENNNIKSLAVGIQEDENFIYIGNVGTGLSAYKRREVLKLLINKVRLDSPFNNFRDKKHIWVEPTVQCYIEFMEWTDGFTLRSPLFKGLLEVKNEP